MYWGKKRRAGRSFPPMPRISRKPPYTPANSFSRGIRELERSRGRGVRSHPRRPRSVAHSSADSEHGMLPKDARLIRRKLDQRHARIPTIKVFILAQKSITPPQLLRSRVEDTPILPSHHFEHFAFTLPLRHLFADRRADRSALPRRSIPMNDLHHRPASSPRRIQRLQQPPLSLLNRRHPRLEVQNNQFSL